MRLPLAFVLCASLCVAVPVHAQSDGGGPPDAGAGPGGGGPGGAGPGGGGPGGGGPGGGGGGAKNKIQELVQNCRQQARSQGLKPQTHEMRQAVLECVVKQKPGMAKMMGCRMEGMDKGLKPGDELKSYVKDCMKRS